MQKGEYIPIVYASTINREKTIRDVICTDLSIITSCFLQTVKLIKAGNIFEGKQLYKHRENYFKINIQYSL